jgi:hypothetical protein
LTQTIAHRTDSRDPRAMGLRRPMVKPFADLDDVT